MEINDNFFKNYLLDAPLPLALERSLECQILSTKTFDRPILDIGCGEGIFAKKLFKEKIDVGIDPNESELMRAKFYDAYEELIQCKGDQIPKKDGTFKTIISNSVMEHIPEIDKVLKEAYRLLSDDGIMYLTLPTNLFDQYTITYQLLEKLGLKSLQAAYRRFFNQFWSHYHYYNSEGWIQKFEQHGFTVAETREYGSKKVCLLNAALTPFSFTPFVTKKIYNRWFLFPTVRKLTRSILNVIYQSLMNESIVKPGSGGLVFFALTKQT